MSRLTATTPKTTVTVYTYSACDTCRKATRWLRAQGIVFVEKPIRETPPSPRELGQMLKAVEGNRSKLFNVAGRDYRDLNLKATLPGMSDADAFELMRANGNLVKRPFLLGDGIALVGFNESAWKEAFAQ